jgi:hypothetical protein
MAVSVVQGCYAAPRDQSLAQPDELRTVRQQAVVDHAVGAARALTIPKVRWADSGARAAGAFIGVRSCSQTSKLVECRRPAEAMPATDYGVSSKMRCPTSMAAWPSTCSPGYRSATTPQR